MDSCPAKSVAGRAPARAKSKTKEVKKDSIKGKRKRKKKSKQRSNRSNKVAKALRVYGRLYRKFVPDHANHRAVGDSLTRNAKYEEHGIQDLYSQQTHTHRIVNGMENIAKYMGVLYIKGVRRAIRHHRQRALKVIGGRVSV